MTISGEPVVLVTQYVQQGFRLLQQTDADPTAACGDQHVSHMFIDGLALPGGGFTLAATVALVQSLQSAQQADSILFAAAGLTASVNRLQGECQMAHGQPGALY